MAVTELKFYFDFTSTFSYIAMHRVDVLAAHYGRAVDWRAVSLGHLFYAQGIVPPPQVPSKFDYLSIDFPRSCAIAGLPCRMPAVFPPDVKLARLVFWYLKLRDESLSHVFAIAVSTAIFGHGADVASAENLAKAAAHVPGVTMDDITAASTDAAAKKAVIAALDDAKADGAFGAPFIILDGEPFWGADRLDHFEHRLAGK